MRTPRKKLLAMSAEEVSVWMKDQGCDFTAEEVKEVGAELQKAAETQKSGELDADELDSVAGGASMARAVRLGLKMISDIRPGIRPISPSMPIRSPWLRW